MLIIFIGIPKKKEYPPSFVAQITSIYVMIQIKLAYFLHLMQGEE